MKIRFAAIVGFILISVQQIYSQGSIVPNGVTLTPVNMIRVIQDTSDGNYTGFFLSYQSETSFQFSPLVDEQVRTFLVSPNDAVSLQPILANSYPELTAGNTYSFANGSPFYLGFFTGNTFPVNGVYSDPLFGWARLVNVNGTIQLLDSALEYGGGGIIAGTQTIIPVPEPTTLGLAAVGLMLLGFRQMRRRG